MKRLYSIIALMIVGLVILWLTPFTVKCDVNPVVTISQPDSTEQTNITNALKNIEDTLTENHFSNFLSQASDGNGNINITFDIATYKPLAQKARQKAMQIMLNGITNSNISAMNRTKIYNFIAGSDEPVSSLVRQLNDDVRADYTSAYAIFAPFSGFIGTLLGVITLAIMILLTFTILVDISYLTIPAFNAVLTKKNTEKPKFVSVEAWKAEQIVEDDKTQTQVLSVYFKMKIKQFVAIGICLLYLVSGQIYSLIANIIDYFRGLIG